MIKRCDDDAERAARMLEAVTGWPVRVGYGRRTGRVMVVAERPRKVSWIVEDKQGNLVTEKRPLRIAIYLHEAP